MSFGRIAEDLIMGNRFKSLGYRADGVFRLPEDIEFGSKHEWGMISLFGVRGFSIPRK